MSTAFAHTPWMQASAQPPARAMFQVDANGRLHMNAHEGQQKALDSTARFILVLAGLQSGKTSLGPWWMLREMALRGPGDYLTAGPTFPLLEMKCLPEYERLYVRDLGWGKLYQGYPPMLVLNDTGRMNLFGTAEVEETRIIFGAGSKPESLESATVKAIHLDEPGQKQFKRGSHEAALGRGAIHRARVLYTTTPYQLGWLKSEVYDRAVADRKLPPNERTYELVQFASTMNPAFTQAEFREMRAKLPAWKFAMRYEGRFERPAGLIYDVFDRAVHVTEDKPESGPRYAGLDFGGVNTAAVEATNAPRSLRYVVTRVYHAGGRTAKEHAAQLSPKPERAWGGAGSEGQWRAEFRAAGYPVDEPPVTGAASVEVGIDRVYALLKNHPRLNGRPDPGDPSQVIVHDPARPYLEFWEGAEGMADLLDDLETYSRELGEDDEPTEKIEDKESFHRLDALRYLATGLVRPDATAVRRPRSTVHGGLSY